MGMMPKRKTIKANEAGLILIPVMILLALYAADAGVEDAIWKIKYGIVTLNNPVAYHPYDYGTVWSYPVSEQINLQDVTVSVKNVWIPQNIPVPTDPAYASNLITTGKLIVAGSVSGASTYQIKISYYKGGTDAPLEIQTLGVWLPPGFTYVTDSSNLESNDTKSYFPLSTNLVPHSGGQAVIWTFNPGTLFAGSEEIPIKDPFPGVDPTDVPMTSTISFSFDSQQPGAIPNAISWVTTAGVSDVPFAWDADTQIFHINSTAGSTQAEAYIAKNELRQLQSSIAGDYYATGNSVLSDTDNDHRRETWRNPSSATVAEANIPADADVAAAYLYWTGWKNDNSVIEVSPLNPDTCNNFTNWTAGSAWDDTTTYNSSQVFRGYTYGRTNPDVKLTLKNSLNMNPYSSGKVFISWNQYESGHLSSTDGLDFAFSTDGGSTWSSRIIAFRDDNPTSSYSYEIPAQYLTSNNFKIQFYLVGFSSSNRYCYIDNIEMKVMLADTAVIFQIDDGTGAKQVYFDEDGHPQQGTQELTATRTQVVQNFSGTTLHGYSYSAFRDVTDLVRNYSQAPTSPDTNYPGYGTYWVGGIYADTLGTSGQEDEWAYACWSLVIIYTSPQTQGHQLYLYDKFTYSNQDTVNGVNVDFDGDGLPGGTISGFIVPHLIAGEVNAGKLTAFVGEGDVWYPGDYVAVNGVRLWDGTSTSNNSKSNPNNGFNSTSMGLGTYDGIDIDTLGIDPPNGQYITWNSNILKEGDTSAQVDLVTHQDVWNVVYIIISFRSEVSTGGSLTYLIKD